MPLASKDGKLYVKTEIDEDGNEVQKLCTTCCGSPPETGRCCIYTGNQVDQGCGDTPDAARDEAELLAGNYTNGFIGVPVEEGDELCLYSCPVYEYLPEFGAVCRDNVTSDFCDSLKTEDVFQAIFTAGATCGTCPPLSSRSNPLP